jgi:GNAT superfamily N-acetyltransferase
MTRAGCIDRNKLKFRLGRAVDVEPLLKLFAKSFFEETGFAEFAVFDLQRAIAQMTRQVRMGETPFIIAEVDGEPAGFAGYHLSHIFTVAPIAYLWVIYVPPRFRRGPIGRMLLWLLFDLARGDGASAFFATVPVTAPSARGLCNLLQRVGCTPMRGAFLRRL